MSEEDEPHFSSQWEQRKGTMGTKDNWVRNAGNCDNTKTVIMGTKGAVTDDVKC